MRLAKIISILLFVFSFSYAFAGSPPPKLLGTMRIGPLTDIASSTSKLSSKISPNYAALPMLALTFISFAPDYQSLDFSSEILIYFFSNGPANRRKALWVALFNTNPGFQNRKLPGKVKWMKGENVYMKHFKDQIAVCDDQKFLTRLNSVPPFPADKSASIVIKFNSAEYIRENRADYEALKETYLGNSLTKKLVREFGPMAGGLIMDRVNDLHYILEQSSDTTITIDFRNDYIATGIDAKPVPGTPFHRFVSAQSNMHGNLPGIARNAGIALVGNINLTPELRKAMTGAGKSENILMSFAGDRACSTRIAPLLEKNVSGRFSWFAELTKPIPRVGAYFYKTSSVSANSNHGLKKTSVSGIYHLSDYVVKQRTCSVYYKPGKDKAGFAVGDINADGASSLLGNKLEKVNSKAPVYGQLRSEDGKLAAVMIADFGGGAFSFRGKLLPAFASYFIPYDMMHGNGGKKGRKRRSINLEKFFKR